MPLFNHLKLSCLFISLLSLGTKSVAQHRVNPERDFSKPLSGIGSGPIVPIKPDSAVLAGILSNGLHYYIRKNTEPHQRAELRLVVKAGSVLEDEDQLGAAHFVEHLQFNGSRHFKKNELVNFMERAGLQFGADLNASTSFDETTYQLSVPTDSSRLNGSNETIFNTAFQVLADWSGAATMENSAIDKERGIITEEWRLGRGASARMRDRYFKEILKGSRYASRIPIGTKESINTMSYDAIRRFYHDWYRPDLEAIIAVGDFDPAVVEKKIKALFSVIPKPLHARTRTLYTIPSNKETLTAIETDPEQVYNIVQVYYKQPKAMRATTADMHQELVRDLFSAMIQSRLTERAREPQPPFLFGAAAYGPFLSNTDIYQCFAVAKNGASILSAMENLVDENLRITVHGFTQAELDRAKENLLSGIDKYYAEREKTGSKLFIQPLLDQFLRNKIDVSATFLYSFTHAEFKSISLNELNLQAALLSQPQNRIALVLAPEKEKSTLPSNLQIKNMLDKKPGALLKAYDDNYSSQPLIAKPPTAGTVVSTKKLPGTAVTELRLSNGMRILVRPGNSTNDQVLFSGFSKGGASSFNDKDYINADFSAEILADAGLATFSAIQLEKKLAGKNVTVRPFVDEYQQGLSGSSGLKDLETAFQLLHLWFSSPRTDSSSFKAFVNREADFRENRLADPGYVFSDTVNSVLSGHNLRKKFPTPKDIHFLEFSKAYKIFRTLFSTPSTFTFVFTGNTDIETIGRYAKMYLAGLPSTGNGSKIIDDLKDYPSGPLQVDVKKGKEQRSQVRIYFTGNTTYDSTINIKLAVIMNSLEIRLRQILREDKGAVYGVGVNGSVSKIPRERYRVGISFACKPSNSEGLIKSVLEEINSLKSKGLDSLTMAKVKAEYKHSFETSLRENAFWLQQLNEAVFFQEGIRNIDLSDKVFQAVSQEESKTLANSFFKDQGRIIFMLDPEK